MQHVLGGRSGDAAENEVRAERRRPVGGAHRCEAITVVGQADLGAILLMGDFEALVVEQRVHVVDQRAV